MAESRKYEPPKPSTGDTAHLVARGAMSVIPGLPELFERFVTPPWERRRDEWMAEVSKALRDLEENRGINLEELQSNDVFIDTVLQATQVALRNSREEKQRALRNAILNAALPNPPDQSLQQMFLNLIDTFTVWHLKLFRSAERWAAENNHQFPAFSRGGSLAQILESAFPELRGKRLLYDQFWKELYQRGLVLIESLHGTINRRLLMTGKISPLGVQFLEFIEEPG
jgi:hypothetical protein